MHDESTISPMGRRQFLKFLAAFGASSFISVNRRALAAQPTTKPPRLVRFPEKTDLILLTDRPPQLETPLRYFLKDFTPNDAFFVRWHLGGIPTEINTRTFRLTIAGHV